MELFLDSGYRGLAKRDPRRIVVPPPSGERGSRWRRPPPTSARATTTLVRADLEHAIAEAKTWRVLKRYNGKRDHLAQTVDAVASLASEQAAQW